MSFNLSLYLVLFLLLFVKTKTQTIIVFGFAVIIFVFLLTTVIKNIYVNDLNAYGQDFNCYYYAAETFGKDLNPYIDEDVITATGSNEEGVVTSGFSIFPYKYTPPTLYLFQIFNLWDYYTASKIWTILKLITFLTCIVIWLGLFKDYKLKTFLILIATFGFQQAAFADFYAGNISIFEAFTVTFAVMFLLKDKILIYCLLIFFLSLFKIQILALILLPLLNFEWRRVKIIAFTLIGGAILFYIYYLFEKILVLSYISELIKTTGDISQYGTDFGILLLIAKIPKFTYLIYFLWISIILTITVWICKNVKGKVLQISLIVFGLLIYGVTVPRFKDYSFVILVVPAAYVISLIQSKILKVLVCLIVCTAFLEYYQLIVSVIILFIIYTVYLRDQKAKISDFYYP